MCSARKRQPRVNRWAVIHMTLAPSHTEEELGEAAYWSTAGCRQMPRSDRDTNHQPVCVCVICPLARTIQQVTDDVPLPHQATSRHKGPLRVKQRPSNCAFEQAAWSVSWWLVGPSGPAVLQIGWGLGCCTGEEIRKEEALCLPVWQKNDKW